MGRGRAKAKQTKVAQEGGDIYLEANYREHLGVW